MFLQTFNNVWKNNIRSHLYFTDKRIGKGRKFKTF